MEPARELSGRAALVTGGGGGLGRRICVALARAGADVAVGWRSGASRAEATASEVESHGARAHLVRLDVSDPASVEKAVAQAAARLGRLDILVNNAGTTRVATGSVPQGDIAAVTPEAWDELMAVNLRGPFLVARAAAPHLRAGRGGRIVNVGSTVALGRWGAAWPFAPSKAAVGPLTRYLAALLAPEIAVNCVAPGLMEGTGMSGGAPEEYVAAWRGAAALGCTTSLDDVAAQVLRFAASGSVTGQVLVMDGGIHFA